MLATTLRAFASQVNEMFAKVNAAKEPLIIERKEGNMVVLSQSDYDELILFLQNKKQEEEDYIQLRDSFFQTSRQALSNVMEKYLD